MAPAATSGCARRLYTKDSTSIAAPHRQPHPRAFIKFASLKCAQYEVRDLKRAIQSRLAANGRHTLLLVYALVLFWVIAHHESWGDEQNAWLLARSHSLWQLAVTILRNQGTPGLWYVVLRLIARLHLGFDAARSLSGVIATCAAYVLLRFSPFPAWIRALLPFTFFLFYQYAVIARQYVFFPLFVFLLAALMSSFNWRPYTFAAVGFLLANTSLHGLCFSVGITVALVTLCKRLPLRESFAASASNKQAALLLIAGWVIAIATAVPIEWSLGAPGLKIATNLAVPLVSVRASTSKVSLPAAAALREGVLYIRPPGMGKVQERLWTASHRRSSAGESLRSSKALRMLILAASVATFPIASSNLLASVFLLLIVIRLYRQHALVLLFPYLLVFTATLATQVYEHHTGLLFVSLLVALWVSLRLEPQANKLESSALLATLLMVTLLQVYWGVHAAVADTSQPYTGDYAASRYLEPLYRSKRIFLGSYVMTSNPPLFSHTFASVPPTLSLQDALRTSPDIVLQGEVLIGDNNLWNQWTPMHRVGASEIELIESRQIQEAGYRETHRFCGSNFMRSGESRILCSVIYEPGHVSFPVR